MIPKKKKTLVRFRKCAFCATKTMPDYKDSATLSKYVSERSRILSADKSSTCSKHQRRVTIAIKRARHLALLPFVSGL